MGNCQAAEAATVIIHNPENNKVDRIYWSVSARQVMNSNPGHYVALVVNSPALMSENGTPLKHLKLLRPHDTLLIGQVYRLISFEGCYSTTTTTTTTTPFDLHSFCLQCNGMLLLVSVLSLTTFRGGADVLKEFAAKKSVKLGKLLKERCGLGVQMKNRDSRASNPSPIKVGQEVYRMASNGSSSRSNSKAVGKHFGSVGGQWKPALQSIAEVGN